MGTDYQRQPQDTVTLRRQVLQSIISEATLSISGVLRIGYPSGTLDRWLGRGPAAEKSHLLVEDEEITVDVSLVVDARHNLQEVSRAVQQEIRRTLQEYVGLQVKAVNVRIEDVAFEVEPD